MWRLKNGAETVREHNNDDESGGSASSETWLRTLNGHLGRQVWEFHPELGTPEEFQQIEDARRGFSDWRFEKRHSSDHLMRIQEDLYYPHPLVQDILWGFLYHAYEPVFMRWPANGLREKALQTVMQHIHYEDENTRYICIGPVKKVLNMLCCWVEDSNSAAFKLHIPRIFDYLWIAEDGMKMLVQTFSVKQFLTDLTSIYLSLSLWL